MALIAVKGKSIFLDAGASNSRPSGELPVFSDPAGRGAWFDLNHQEITIETGTEYSKGWGQWLQVFRIKHLGQTIIDSTGTGVEERVERGWA